MFFLGAGTWLLIKILVGIPTRTVEYYCPMGGIVSFWGLIRGQHFICALNEMNVSMAVALLVSVVLVKKSFCGWVCPMGTLFEWMARGRRKVPGRDRGRIPDRLDSRLVYLRYIVLGLILVLSYRFSELVFRGYDPFYILFTGARGHETIPVLSAALLGAVFLLAFAFEMSWCRYLCPLNAAMSPLSRIGLLKVRRDDGKCSRCGACDRACLQRIPVSQLESVTKVDCTNCLNCVSECPVPGAIYVGW